MMREECRQPLEKISASLDERTMTVDFVDAGVSLWDWFGDMDGLHAVGKR